MDRKGLVARYKNRSVVGGVFAIKNAVLDKWYIDCTDDLRAAENRFDFMADSYMRIAKDYHAQAGQGFSFEALEELTRGETQTDSGFREDLALLKEMWLEKLAGQALY
jgi:hypothetical protein